MRWTRMAAVLMLGLATPLLAQEHDEAMQEEGHEEAMHAVPEAGLRAELIQDLEQLEEKYMSLAKAMTEHWDWRPMEGVRSTGEVFGHVANGNFYFPNLVGVEPQSQPPNFEEVTDPEQLIQGLEHSIMHVRHAIAEVSDEELDETTEMFGQEATKRQVLQLLVNHMHEHMGQAIAYARSNGVAPPWSGGQ